MGIKEEIHACSDTSVIHQYDLKFESIFNASVPDQMGMQTTYPCITRRSSHFLTPHSQSLHIWHGSTRTLLRTLQRKGCGREVRDLQGARGGGSQRAQRKMGLKRKKQHPIAVSSK